MKVIAWIGGAVVVLFVLMMVVGGATGSDEKSRKRRVIELCWEDQQRKSATPGEQRFIAGACEQLESEFVQKFGHKP